MKKLPPDRLRLPEALEKYRKYGFTADALRNARRRNRLKVFRVGHTWYTTDRAMREYIESRDIKKIPKRYKKKA